MTEQEQRRVREVDPSSVDPDELVSHIAGVSLMKTSLISVGFHVLLIGVTSIGFISLCVKHGTLHPKAVINQLAAEQREAERAEARRAARQKALKTQAAREKAATRPKSPIEKTLTEKSFEKPKPSELKLPEP